MAKPIISFSGKKFQSGQNTGYYPLLSTPNKKTDLDVAEEICIEKRLSLSPDELLYAVKATLETVPQLIQMDGINREFSGLLRWFRTAKGRLDGVAGAWNDSCKAYVRAQLMKDTKGLIDATFVNEVSIPVPKLDNVTWVGALGVYNVVKRGYPFAAYGRYMQFISGTDTAYLVYNGTSYPLTVVSSDVSNTKFNWPTGIPSTIEAGSTLKFVMNSRAGIAGGPTTTVTKDVVMVEGDNVIDQTPDHLAWVNEFMCQGSSTEFVYGQYFSAFGNGMWPDSGGTGPWHFEPQTMCYLVADDEHEVEIMPSFGETGTTISIESNYSGESLPAGRYPNAYCKFTMVNWDTAENYQFRLPCPLTVNA